MTKPSECRWCGCDKVWLSRGTVIVFDCGSSWSANDGLEISTECRIRCSDLAIQQRDRIQRAVDTLKKAKRYTVTPGPRNTLDWDRNPDSPVTDSAEVDYFEAVRQRVPWMVAVKHIEGLVEGYRQCGVMAWKTAEHIQRIYGGGYGKAD